MNALDRAADRLRGHWRKGAMRDLDGNVCLVGAVHEATDDAMVYARALDAVNAELRDMGLRSLPAVFNDDPSTTEEDVLLLLKLASARLDETGQP